MGSRWLVPALVGAPLGLGLLFGGVASVWPEYFRALFLIDLLIFASPHLAATFTRLDLAGPHAKRDRFFAVWMLPVSAACVAGAVYFVGDTFVSTLFFFWQAFHYARQGYGIARLLEARDGTHAMANSWCLVPLLYAVPAAGVLNRCAEGWTRYLGAPLWLPSAPQWMAWAGFAASAALFAAWVIETARRRLAGEAGTAAQAFALTHVSMFTFGYILAPHITRGWLGLSVWHSTQYLVLAWAMNLERFASGPDPGRPWISRISQPGRAWAYACTLLAGSILIVSARFGARVAAEAFGLPFLVLLVRSINFHHYVVDGVIWRLRSGTISKELRRPILLR